MLRALLAGLVLAVLASGCASLTPETAAEESAYLALTAIDAAQTVNIAHTPGLYESESAAFIGREPSRSAVYAYLGGQAVLHASAGAYMDAHGYPRWARRLFEAVTIADEANCVRGNYQLGITAHF